MPVSDATFEAMHRRKREQAAALRGSNQPRQAEPDPYAAAVQAHAEAVQKAHAKTQAVLPERGPRQPASVPTRAAWDLDIHQIVGDIELTTSLHLELRRLVEAAGRENLLAGLQALGIVSRFEKTT